MASLVRRSSFLSKSGCAASSALSSFRLRIFDVILWYVFLLWLFVIFFISVLKDSQSSCGLFVALSMLFSFRSFISSCSLIPHFTIFPNVFWSSIWFSGHVQRPFPVRGASLGAYFIWTSQWSVGTIDASIFQLKVCCCRCLATYILLILDWICWFPAPAR